jgi:hypothetical protein
MCGQHTANKPMKRLSEIMGKTPMFVRWAIEQTCPMREVHDGSDPFAVEKQLYAIKTGALAVHENRVVEGIAMHDTCRDVSTGIEQALGFPLEEPFSAYGGFESVQQICHSCDACVAPNQENLDRQEKLAANCFGWLILDFENPVFCDHLNAASLHADTQAATFPTTIPSWYNACLARKPNMAQLSTIEKLANRFNVLTKNAFEDWLTFANAIRTCRENPRQIHMQLVPAGFSDGVIWSIGPYCPECKFAQDERTSKCEKCHRTGKPHPVQRRRAKGIRPYLRLLHLVGPEKTRQLLIRFQRSQ